ncbi:hypothetical protein LTS02_006703 [Friedmanniomyces endolithicus]|nr:hypothetical protein LTS02_006703 [Friedmanniomyces endolithicus]
MAFVLRRPFAIASAVKQLPKASQVTVRSFQTKRKLRFTKPSHTRNPPHHSKPSPTPARMSSVRPFNRAVEGDIKQQHRRTRSPRATSHNGSSTAAQSINLIFNRETRDDGGMPPLERAYLNDTFLHTGLGIGIIGVAARALHTSGWSYRLMSANPWLVLGIGLVGSIGTMMGCRATDPDNYVVKYGLFTAFNLTQAALLSPMLFFSPAILARAGLYTVGMMGSIAFVGATAKQEKYLYLGGPLLAGVAIVALSGLAPLVLPATPGKALMWTENIWLYGGLAVFGGFTLYDVQKILAHARMAERGMFRRDAVNESISLELDFINIFVRMVQILAMQQGRRK